MQDRRNRLRSGSGPGPEAQDRPCACAASAGICPECYAAWVRASQDEELRAWLESWDEPEPPTVRGNG